MFAKTARGRIWTLIVLGLLLASLVPPAAPAYAGLPEEDTRLYPVAKHPAASGAQPFGTNRKPTDRRTPWNNFILGGGVSGQSPSRGNSPYSGLVSDPITSSVGEYHFRMPLLNLGGPLPLHFTLYYASRLSKWAGYHNDPFGDDDFTHNYHISLWRLDETTAVVLYTEGNLITFEKGSGWHVINEEVVYQLKEDDDHYYMMDPIRELVYTFDKATALWGTRQVGLLTRIEDRNGNALTLTNEADGGFYRLTRIEDGLGRSLDFAYENPTPTWHWPHLASVTDQVGRTIRFDYQVFMDPVWAIDLVTVTDAMGYITTFTYTGSPPNTVIASRTLPRGNTPYVQTYEEDEWGAPRVVAQTDAYGNTTSLSFDDDAGVTTITDPLGNTYRHTHQDQRLLTQWTDQAGNTATLDYDDQGRPTSLTDRMGDTAQITYHAETGEVASITDAEGNTTTFIYTPQEQTFGVPTCSARGHSTAQEVTFTFYDLTRIEYPDGTHEEFAYDEHGNVTAYTDRVGNQWAFTYNDRGWLLTVTNPEGGMVTYTYNADGTLASSTDSDTGTTTYTYDAYKRLSTITWPDGSTVHFTYDLNDRLLSFTDEGGHTTTFTYDANGNRLTLTDPLGHTYTYAYDLMDRLSGFTDPLGHSGAFTYDEMGRPASFTDRNGHTTTYAYDPRGWFNAVTDPAGHTRTIAYDDEGVPSGFTTPLGHSLAFQTDKLGRTTRITDPLGAATHFTYDQLGRLTSFTDRMGRHTAYAYNGEGWLTGVTRPVVGAAAYTRNGLGLLTRITDLGGKHWDFAYTPMGRLASRTDPLGNRWSYAYDNRGRLQQISYPDGTSATFTYDPAGNLTQAAYPGGLTLNYTYDELNRLLTAEGLALTYDVRGDIVESRDGSASFGATYDAGRRLKTVTYDGLATVTYTYDERDLVVRVEDDLSGAWMEFAYDDDGRLTEIRRSNGVTTRFTYDDAGRVTRIQETKDGAPVADQQYTLNAEGDVVQVARTLPFDPAPEPEALALNLTYDDASQITSPGYGYDAWGRQTAAPGRAFAYDGASRLVSVTADGTTATLTYNGLGDLRTRTVDGATTHYYHNYALGLWPIVAEASAQTSGSLAGSRGQGGEGYKRFYVYTPGGALLYSMEPGSGAVRFYHFDRVGSTLFLTDGSGDVTDAYAYDPYGNLLGHTGTSDQPFTYVGRYGVRCEPVGSLYDMRARAYDPATARFLTRDLIWPVLDDSESLNPYQYAYQNPLQYVDPRGTYGQISGRWVQTGLNTYVIIRDGREVATVRYVDGKRIIRPVGDGGERGISSAQRAGERTSAGPGKPPFAAFAGFGNIAGVRKGLPEAASAGLIGMRTPFGSFSVDYMAHVGRIQTIGAGLETPFGGIGFGHSTRVGGAGTTLIVRLPGDTDFGAHAMFHLPSGTFSVGGAISSGKTKILGFQVGARHILPTVTVSTPLGNVPLLPWQWFMKK